MNKEQRAITCTDISAIVSGQLKTNEGKVEGRGEAEES